MLPEIWNSAYQTTEFPKNAEDVDGGLSKCADFMSKAAKQHGITLVGGSIPELSGGKTYNTCLVFDKAGKLLAKHRKVDRANGKLWQAAKFLSLCCRGHIQTYRPYRTLWGLKGLMGIFVPGMEGPLLYTTLSYSTAGHFTNFINIAP